MMWRSDDVHCDVCRQALGLGLKRVYAQCSYSCVITRSEARGIKYVATQMQYHLHAAISPACRNITCMCRYNIEVSEINITTL